MARRTWPQRPKQSRVRWDPSPPQMHTQHLHFQPGLHRFFNEVRLHWFPSPPFGSPFHSFPFTHLFLLFLFMSSLASCPFISLLSFSCAHNGLGLSLYAHIYFYTQVLGRPGLDNEVGFIGCPCALGFSFIATTHTHFVSVLSSFSCLHPFVLAARAFALSS